MNEYEFTLKFRLPEFDADPETFLEALAEAGCDGATVGVGQRGRIALDFIREGRNALSAIASAVKAVKRAIPGVELVEASPDFVGLTDMADLIGCSRQNMRKLVINNAATFPTPVHEGAASLWHLRPVLDWLSQSQKRSVDRALMEVSEVTMKVNIARESRHLRGSGIPSVLESLLV